MCLIRTAVPSFHSLSHVAFTLCSFPPSWYPPNNGSEYTRTISDRLFMLLGEYQQSPPSSFWVFLPDIFIQRFYTDVLVDFLPQFRCMDSDQYWVFWCSAQVPPTCQTPCGCLRSHGDYSWASPAPGQCSVPLEALPKLSSFHLYSSAYKPFVSFVLLPSETHG